MDVNLDKLLKEGRITKLTFNRVSTAKSIIEKKYSLKIEKEKQKKKEWEIILQKISDLNISPEEKHQLKQNLLHKESELIRQQRKKITIYDFNPIAIIGKGAFGEVRVCRQKETGEIVAIKKMKKQEMTKKNQILHLLTEKEIMAKTNPWVVKLRYAFQDDDFLYLVMDFLPGGDLMSLLMQKDIFKEEEAQFYLSEMILAVDAIHKLDCIHRDLKPDNILIDANGHIQITDFGLSKISDNILFPISSTNTSLQTNEPFMYQKPILTPKEHNIFTLSSLHKRRNRMLAYSTVGTPDYIAPEVLSNKGYGPEVDWWSVGAIFFEMVVGYPPFFSNNQSETCKKIIKWNHYLKIPFDSGISLEARDLIMRFMAPAEKRIGLNGVNEIKEHPFFKGVNWEDIKKRKAPFIPKLKNKWDVKYFDSFKEEEPFYPVIKIDKKKKKDVSYAGYTFNREVENMNDGFRQSLEIIEKTKRNIEKKEMEKEYKQRISLPSRIIIEKRKGTRSPEWSLNNISNEAQNRKDQTTATKKTSFFSRFKLRFNQNQTKNQDQKVNNLKKDYP